MFSFWCGVSLDTSASGNLLYILSSLNLYCYPVISCYIMYLI